MAPKLRLTTVNAGPFTMPKEALVYGATGTITVPSTVAVIEHSAHGLILFDTGVNHRVADPGSGEDYWGPGLRSKYGAEACARPGRSADLPVPRPR
ncbi:hypothetical protein AB0B45_45195 [Nonomuraea sp. NPDC049152]|uniref:hypothetical protein n=1 Tax=Nonomuraea sp. NPDC049152 TaxID=3154350 RepID=UPI0033C0312A